MKFNSQICTTKEQSERLLALGLKKETADMFYFWVGGNEYRLKVDVDNNPLKYNMDRTYIPAWSLHRLLCLLPTEYTYDIDFQQIMRDFVFGSKDMYEEVISCIEILIKEGYFYKEYLEE